MSIFIFWKMFVNLSLQLLIINTLSPILINFKDNKMILLYSRLKWYYYTGVFFLVANSDMVIIFKGAYSLQIHTSVVYMWVKLIIHIHHFVIKLIVYNVVQPISRAPWLL